MREIRPLAEKKIQESISEDEYSKLQSLKKRNDISLKFYPFSTSFCSSLEAPPPFPQNTCSRLSFWYLLIHQLLMRRLQDGEVSQPRLLRTDYSP